MAGDHESHVLDCNLVHRRRERGLRLAKWLIMAALVAALACIQVPPRFLLLRYAHYGWPFVHLVRHVEIRANQPTEIYYMAFVPGLVFDLLAWAVLISSAAMVLRHSPRTGRAPTQIHVSTILWLLTAAAVLLALYRVDPRDFWALNRILRVEPGWIQAMLFFGLGCLIYTVVRSMTQLFWEALAPHVARITGDVDSPR